MPSALLYTMHDPKYNWKYYSEPEPYLNNRRIFCPRGKMIGGCSSHNGMVFVRGNPLDFERWASYGLPNWSYKNVLPYFKKLETWSGGENLYRGGKGPLKVNRSKIDERFPLFNSLIMAAAEAGSINSPKILQLSGVGDPKLLKQNNIEVIHELPGVGQNLQDHLEIYIQHKSKTKDTLYNLSTNYFTQAIEGIKWFLLKQGMLTYSHLELGGFVKTSKKYQHPNIQLHFFPSLVINHGLTNPLSVVDQETKVHGLDNIRVIDSSIMPDILSGNLNAGTIMIAEKAADMIMGKQEDPINAEFYN